MEQSSEACAAVVSCQEQQSSSPTPTPTSSSSSSSSFLSGLSEDRKKRSLAVVLGLAVGDALGATSEFQIPWEVTKYCIDQYEGWPAKLVGGGVAGWLRGQPTDDSEMAMAILDALHRNGGVFDATRVLKHFLAWLRTNPPDVGATTRRTLMKAAKTPDNPFAGGEWDYTQYGPSSAANGGLMRNGVIGAIFCEEGEAGEIAALDATVLQSIITHYAPLPVLTCVVQTLLIRHALFQHQKGETLRAPTIDDIKAMINGPWANWKLKTSNPHSQHWLGRVGATQLKEAEAQLISELDQFHAYDPYNQDYRGRSGYCVLTLFIALWAVHWSFQSTHPALPDWLPEWPFQKHGYETIMWVALIGADADTYAATAGPLLAAYHPNIPDTLTDGLMLKDKLHKIFS
jgi:ADP-ribosylglycohydrolase